VKFLIVDDEAGARRTLKRIVRQLGSVEIAEAADAGEARAMLAAGDVDIALLDLCLDPNAPDRQGLDLVREIRAGGCTLPIVVSGSRDTVEVRAAMRLGAFDYILKDELNDEIALPLLREILRKRILEREVISLRARRPSEPLDALVGTSRAMQQLREIIQRVSVSDRPVLVTGPTGAGKEVVVRAIHALGPHPDEPLLDLNCGAVPAPLIESQLFGHERGAFTGADRKQDGFLTAVRRGTLFLDEIAELPLELQAKLLRVLEAGTFRPVGSSQVCTFEGRVVAATHAALDERVAQHAFREDLYYRLAVLEVNVPSLESRREDVPALVAHFAARQPRPLRFTAEAIERLQRAPWPGNVRQLRNTIDRLAVFASHADVITPEVLDSLPGTNKRPAAEPRVAALVRSVLELPDQDKLQFVEDALIDEAIRLTAGNKTAAARLLGVHRKAVERRLDRSSAPAREPEE
jgi:DNA-binding NtrC family response regulator